MTIVDDRCSQTIRQKSQNVSGNGPYTQPKTNAFINSRSLVIAQYKITRTDNRIYAIIYSKDS